MFNSVVRQLYLTKGLQRVIIDTILPFKLPYGMKQGVLTHVREVKSGLECECVCPACGARLIARKGKIRQHHFAHASDSECKYGVETALHLAAKKILEQRMEIILPAIIAEFYSPAAAITLAQEQTYKLDQVVLETRVGQIVPDVFAFVNGAPLLIEIRVTHKVTPEKAAQISDLGYSAIEIDLSNISRELEMQDIERLVMGPGKHKKWIKNVAAQEKRKEVLSKATIFKTIPRAGALHVDGCPISARTFYGKSYANYVHNCLGCERLLSITRNIKTISCGVAIPPAT